MLKTLGFIPKIIVDNFRKNVTKSDLVLFIYLFIFRFGFNNNVVV